MDRVTSADGTTIAYERFGHGPPMVLVHGTGRDRSYWAQSLPDLTQHATVYAVDRRGRGGSGDTDQYSIEREAGDILAVIDAVGEPLNLFGHSYGAIIALEAASRAEHLRSLILYEPPLSVGTDRVPSDLGDRLEAIMDTGAREEVFMAFLREGPRYSPEQIEAQRARPDWPDRLAFAHTLPRETRAVGRYEFAPERFVDLRIPTLLLIGSESPPFFHQAIDALRMVLPRCEQVVLEGQHHNAIEVAPGLCAEAVHSFLSGDHNGEQRE